MKIYYNNRKENILRIRDFIEYGVLDTLKYIPRISEDVIIHGLSYKVENIVVDLDKNIINIYILYDN